jgi:5-formyltetrahydrofolate cyclo-ligase
MVAGVAARLLGLPVQQKISPARMIPLKEQKKQLRQQALARRDALPVAWRIEVSLDMVKAAERIEFEPGSVISGFWPMRSEADLRPLMDALRQKGARLCLPAILDKTTIVFRELERGAELVAMGYGTTGPGEEAAVLDPAIMLIPLSAFDARGHRIGYGAGYYDRAIERLHDRGLKPRLIGVAFECQQVELVPEEPHDVVLDEILTESGLRRF